MKKFIIAALAIMATCAWGMTAEACTLWAASGSVVEGGGSLIVKNRDWVPDHTQEVKLISPDDGYRYIGLFAVDGRHKGLKAGINEKGLVVVSASASSIPSKQRKAMPYTHALYEKLLKECGSVDEAIEKTDLFLGPQFIMMADQYKIATIEIGPEGKYSIAVKENEAVFHTNHYVAESMAEFNQTAGRSSHIRYNRIAELLNDVEPPYNLDTFISFSTDQNDGPDNSIFRTGSTPQKERTMATWAVSLPRNSSPELYVRLLNPGESERVTRIDVDDVFSGKVQLN